MNAVAARFCADVDHGIANAFGFGQKNFFLFSDAERESVDERILRIARLEADFAADSGHTKTISVTPDSANYAVEDAAVCGGGGGGRGVCARPGGHRLPPPPTKTSETQGDQQRRAAGCP